MQQFATYRQLLWYKLQIHFDYIWPCVGQINIPVFTTGHLGYELCSSVFWARTPYKDVRKAFTAQPTPPPKDDKLAF